MTYNFLKELFDIDELKNTTVFIAADHGFALMGVYKLTNANDFPIEYNLPLLVLIVPIIKKILLMKSNILKFLKINKL